MLASRCLCLFLMIQVALIPMPVMGDQITGLRVDTSIERQLLAGQTHLYEAQLTRNRPWLLQVEQKGVDVSLEASGPGCSPCKVNSPTYRRGPETLLLQPEVEATWKITVRSRLPNAGPGNYEIRLAALPMQSPEDQQRLDAEASVTAAGRLFATQRSGQAIGKYRQALDAWQALGNDRRKAWTLLALAILHAREPENALSLLEETLPLFRDLGQHNLAERFGEAITLNDLGQRYSDLGDSTTSREFLQKALDAQQKLANLFGQVIARNNLCLADHRQGSLKQAGNCYRSILELSEQAQEGGLTMAILGSLGNVNDRLGEPALAEKAYGRSLSLARTSGDRRAEATILSNLGVLSRRLGEMQQAIRRYSEALEIVRQLGDRRSEARLLSNLGSAYYWLGEPHRARAFLEEALPIRKQQRDLRGVATTLNNLARVESSLGELETAERRMKEALEASREGKHRPTEAATLGLLGQTLLASGQPEKALTQFNLALEILTSTGDRRGQAHMQHQIGEALLQQNRPDEALATLRQARDHRTAIQDRQGQVLSLAAIAVAEARLGRLPEALATAQMALEGVENLRARIVDPDLRAAFASSQRRAHELELELLMKLHTRAPESHHDLLALEASERARTRTLVDLLNQAEARIPQNIDPGLREDWESLQRRRDAKAYKTVEALSRGESEDTARLELFEVLTRLENVEDEIRRLSPAYADLTAPRPLSALDIQGLLDPHTTLLEYALGEERSFLWLVTRDSVHGFELPGRSQIEEASRLAYETLSTRTFGAVDPGREPLARLSQLVLGPVGEHLDGERLVVVADGALHYIPFAALPLPAADATDAQQRAPRLLERFEVVHLPSASALAVQREKRGGRPRVRGEVAVLADPVFDPRDARFREPQEPSDPTTPKQREETLRQAIDLGLSRLGASAQEAEAIMRLVPAEKGLLAKGFEASRELAFSGRLKDYRVIHFATHGLIDASRPELSGLVLSLVDREGRGQDGFLRLRDLYNLELNGDLVVLSGCRTALGKEVRGEGLVGLTRGFMYAGVPRVVASLWQVEDKVTADLMANFYSAMLKDGLPAAAALRKAQLTIATEPGRGDPFFWSAFILQGDWR